MIFLLLYINYVCTLISESVWMNSNISTLLKNIAMKKTLLVLSITLLGTLLSSNVKGQAPTAAANNALNLGLVEVTMLATTATTVQLTLAPVSVGLAIQPSVSDDSKRLQISSIVTGSVGTPVPHTIKASLDAGSTVPPGTYLNLQATVPDLVNGTSGGTLGLSAGDVKLPMTTGSAVNIITGIGSCFSGAAADNGYILKYTWGVGSLSNYQDIRATASTGTAVTVVLTLSSVQ
jgi:hypothetical protein